MKKGRIRKANRYIKRISENEGFYLAHKLDSGIVKTKIEGMDLNEDYKIPTPPKMSYKYLIENIRGKQRIDKTQREKFEQTINWRITDWHGKEHTGISSYTRERYKRVYSNPKEVKLAIVKIDEEEYVITELLKFSEDNNEYNCL